MVSLVSYVSSFFCNDTAPTEIYTLSLHDALPICIVAYHKESSAQIGGDARQSLWIVEGLGEGFGFAKRSEEHTSELQSLRHLVCRLLLEKKKKKTSATKRSI